MQNPGSQRSWRGGARAHPLASLRGPIYSSGREIPRLEIPDADAIFPLGWADRDWLTTARTAIADRAKKGHATLLWKSGRADEPNAGQCRSSIGHFRRVRELNSALHIMLCANR